MKVANIRLGFATNSSSTHSIIRLDEPRKEVPVLGDYGWEHFLLTRTESKLAYLQAQIENATLPEEEIAAAAVDHQSIWRVLDTLKNHPLYNALLKDIEEYLKRPDIAIAGGNDNEEGPWDPGKIEPLTYAMKMWDPVISKHGDWWVFLDRAWGDRITFSLKQNPRPLVYQSPLLVDLKITNQCHKGCSYCFEGSCPTCKHAYEKVVYDIVDRLHMGGVMEIVLGGGEPTLFPDFYALVNYIKDLGIVVGFSTGDPQFYKHGGVPEAHAIGLSIRNLDEARAFLKLELEPKNRFHIIPELWTMKNLEKLLKISPKDLLLLGLKADANGNIPDSTTNVEEALDYVLNNRFANGLRTIEVAVDTQIARTVDLGKWKVPPEVYELWEGNSSMAVDAITETMAKASYYGERFPFDEDWLRRFISWQGEDDEQAK